MANCIWEVSSSGIPTLPPKYETVYLKILPQRCLWLRLTAYPGAGKTIMADLLIKKLRFREDSLQRR